MGKKYGQLRKEERDTLYGLLAGHKGVRAIAKIMGRHWSTIYREVKRNRNDIHHEYLPDTAQELSQSRRYHKPGKIESSKRLQKEIEGLVRMGLAPEVIAGRLKLELGKQVISHESIYKWIYGAGKSLELQKHLVRKKRTRGSRQSRKVDKIKIPNRVSIHDRPPEHTDEFGNWDGDTIHFADHKGSIVTLYERTCKLTLGAKMETLTSQETLDNMETIFRHLPPIARKSTTLDNGKEFTDHQKLHEIFGMNTYFCDPYASWQKGGVENANGIIRRYIPKGSRSEDYSPEQVQAIIHTINSTPRKSLSFKTPYEAFLTCSSGKQIIFSYFNNHVALQI